MKNSTINPPKQFLKFFRWFCHDDLKDYIEGDLMELYKERLQTGKRKADLKFILDVMFLFRPGIIRPAKPYQALNNYSMFKSYFKIGWRNLLKNKSHSAINIGGLALGLTVAGLISLWIYDELSFNKYHKNYEQIAQIMKGGMFEGRSYTGQRHLPYPLVDELQQTYGSNFKHIVPSAGAWESILTADEKMISALGSFVGSGAPELYSFEMLEGQWSGLNEQESIMISRSAALALFGTDKVLDKNLRLNSAFELKVTGVFEDFPRSSSLHGVKFFGTWDFHVSKNPWMKEQGWENHFFQIYAQIAPNTTIQQVADNIRDAEIKVIKDLEYMKGEMQYSPRVLLHPMKDWHLRSNFKEGVLDSAPALAVWYMGIIGTFVLLLACINFMNLSTARSEKRAREVGIRKTMGSIKSQLISQFFSESFLVVIFAFLVAIVLVNLFLPLFNDFSGKTMHVPVENIWFWVGSLTIILVTGLLAGSYPAFYLSSFNPVKVLKGTFKGGRLSSMPRQILVVLQFTISIMLIICTLIVYNQITFAKDRSTGYNREGLIMIQKKSDAFTEMYDALTIELKQSGAVTQVSESAGILTEVWSGNGGFNWEGKNDSHTRGFSTLSVSHDFGRTVGWNFVDGRDFSKEIASDSSALVINESAAKYMGLKNPVGQVVHWENRGYNVDKDFIIVGVIQDMLMQSPFEPVEPAVFFVQGWKGWINIRINPSVKTAEALPQIETVFKKLIPTAPFQYKFADQEYATKFMAEERLGTLSAVFSALAILISCLGLFGLASYIAEQRTKELGIRKVLGASVTQLWKLMSKDFFILVLVACLIAIPISFVLMSNWLTQYQYRTTIAWEMFAIVGAGAMLITLLTVSYQAIHAAMSNPVSSLRSE
jgi:ABC-type antimicrobial peptide transport system permease subunit